MLPLLNPPMMPLMFFALFAQEGFDRGGKLRAFHTLREVRERKSDLRHLLLHLQGRREQVAVLFNTAKDLVMQKGEPSGIFFL